METKKKAKGDLEGRKNSFLLLGLVIVLSLIYASFELFATANNINNLGLADDDEVFYIDDKVLNTDQTPPKPIAPEINKTHVLDVVKGNIKLETPFIFDDIPFDAPITDYKPVDIIEIEPSEQPPEKFVDEMPEFPGGMDALQPYLKRVVRYPEAARQIGVSGVVFVQFVVEKDGSISNVNVLVPVYPDLDAEAVRVIKEFPKWKPGKLRGKTVRVYFQIPIRFTIS